MARKKAKKVKVHDLKPKKDTKGGGPVQHGPGQHGPGQHGPGPHGPQPNMFYFGGLTN
jgi:hypothetical protein